jgi:hypothetical protein
MAANVFCGIRFRKNIPITAPAAINGSIIKSSFTYSAVIILRLLLNGTFSQLTTKKNHACVPTYSIFSNRIARR